VGDAARAKITKLDFPDNCSVPHLLEPAGAVAGMLSALKTLTPKSGAHYVDYKGESINW
jgi:hypothetical protein